MKGSAMKYDKDKDHQHPKETKGLHQRVRENWRNVMASVHNKLSRGAEYVSRMIQSAHKDQWYKSQSHGDHHKAGGNHKKKD